jgi:hypothetical protein
MNGPIAIQALGALPSIAPGSPVVATFVVSQRGGAPVDLVFGVRGLNGQAVFRPPALSLPPDGSVTASVTITANQAGSIAIQALTRDGRLLAELPVGASPLPAAGAQAGQFAPGPAGRTPPRGGGGGFPVVPVLAALASFGVIGLGLAALGWWIFGLRPTTAEAALKCASVSPLVVSLIGDDTTTAIKLTDSRTDTVRLLRTEPAEILPGLFDPLLALSGDGQRIAYVTARNMLMDDATIWTFDVASPARATQVVEIPNGLWPVKPVWSPDGRSLAYVRLNPELAAQGQTQLEFWVVEIGREPRRLGPVADLTPAVFFGDNTLPLCWAEDNQTLIFSRDTRQTELKIGTGVVAVKDRAAIPAVPPRSDRSVIAPVGSGCGVPVYSQNDPRWRRVVMLRDGDEIGGFGCALTSVTMIMNHFGAVMTPAELNECLGPSANPLVWARPPGCTNGLVRGGNRLDFSYPALDDALAGGAPVVVGLMGGQAGSHFVVVTSGGGGNAADYAVTDPWDGSTNKSLQYFFNTGYRPRWIITYAGTAQPCERIVPAQPRPAIAGPADGGIYRQPVTVQAPKDEGTTTTVTNLWLNEIANEPAAPPANTPTAQPAATGTPTASAAPPSPPGRIVQILNRLLSRRAFTGDLSIEDEGIYEVQATRRVGDSVMVVRQIRFTIDRTPPVVQLRPLTDPATGMAQFAMEYADPLSGIADLEYQLDGGDWQTLSTEISTRRPIVVDAPGDHTVAFRATDLAGNVSEVRSATFLVGDAPPEATPTPAPETPTPVAPTETPRPPAGPTATARPGDTATPTPSITPTPSQTATAGPTATNTPMSMLAIAPTTVNFGAVELYRPAATRALSVTNTGGAPATNLQITVAPTGEFSRTTTCTATLAPGASCTITAYFTPAEKGERSATVTASAAGNQSVSARLTGTGVQAEAVLSPAITDFGRVAVGETSTREFTVRNTGTAPLIVRPPSVTDDYTLVNNCAGPVAPNAQCTISVTFRPSATGDRSGTLTVPHNGPNSPATSIFRGIGATPRLVVQPLRLDFGNILIDGASAAQNIFVQNQGDAPISGLTLTIFTNGATTEFVERARTCGATLAPGAECTISVAFTPKNGGLRTGSVVIAGSGQRAQVTITGTGVVPGPR